MESQREKIWPKWRNEASELLARHNLQGVVIIACEKDGSISSHTWGADTVRCNALAKWITGFERNFSLIPFQTIFGWGNGGVGKGLGANVMPPAGWEEFTQAAMPVPDADLQSLPLREDVQTMLYAFDEGFAEKAHELVDNRDFQGIYALLKEVAETGARAQRGDYGV